jgi:hypothetical protein
MGAEIWRPENKQFDAGLQSFVLDANSLNLSKGVYILKLEGAQQQLMQGVIYN